MLVQSTIKPLPWNTARQQYAEAWRIARLANHLYSTFDNLPDGRKRRTLVQMWYTLIDSIPGDWYSLAACALDNRNRGIVLRRPLLGDITEADL